MVKMKKFKCKGVDQATVNAELRDRFGETATRQDLLAYRTETGIDPKWIRRNPEARTGRGLYRIPSAVDAPVSFTPPPVTHRLARGERAVLPTPFDDGEYDGDPEPTTPVAKSSRGRKRSDEAEQSLFTQPDYDPAIQERAVPVFVHAWVCADGNCPGRKPGAFYGEGDASPVCECGSPMTRHSWAKRTRF